MKPTLNVAAYRFVPVSDPNDLAAQLVRNADQKDLQGTILVAPEGLNFFLAGAEGCVRAFVGEVEADSRFAEMVVKESYSTHVPFRRLKVRVEREIITFDPNIDPCAKIAPSVSPKTLAQ